MIELPSGWTETVLGEVAETRLGKMLSAKSRIGTNPLPYLRNKNVQWGRFDLSDVLEMDFSEDEITRFTVEVGDLLVCEGGEVGRAAVWRGELDDVAYQKALHRVRPRPGVLPEFLLYLLMRLSYTNGFEPFVTGSTIKHLPQEDLRLLPVPLPPTNEQRRIVAVIEEQFARLEAAEAELRRAEVMVGRLRVAAIDSAFDTSWPVQPFGAVARVASDLVDPAAYQDAPHIAPNHIESGTGRLLPYGTIADDGVTSSKHRFRSGQILYSKIRPYLKKATLIDFDGLCSADMYPVETELDSAFLLWWMLSERFTSEAITHQGRSVLPKINREALVQLSVPVPPADLQRRCVDQVERSMSAIEASCRSIETARRRSVALRRSILQRAFSGELVPQDRTDEPATALLTRIRGERVSDGPRRRRRRVNA